MTAPAESAAETIDGPTEGTETAAAESEKDWKAEFEAQQRINRDLERKSKRSFDDMRKQILAEEAKKAPSAKAGDEKIEVDLDALRQQVRDESRAETLRDKALDKIEAKAARLFKDPEDALLRLGKNVDEYIVDGKVDIEAITDALDDLLKKRPDFGVAQGDPKRFQGTADAGPKASAGKPQMTKDEMQKLYREGKTEEIEAARKAGQLNNLLGIKG